jgi:hypothetical protein
LLETVEADFETAVFGAATVGDANPLNLLLLPPPPLIVTGCSADETPVDAFPAPPRTTRGPVCL